MYLIYLSLTIVLILTNFAALTLITSRYLPATASARVLGTILVVLSCFALEHWIGLGRLAGVWPILTLISLNCLRQCRELHFWRREAVFIAGFFYALAWRFAYPNIDAGSEHLMDLYLIGNFLDGNTLPVADRWLAGEVFDCYYPLQHYAAALLARVFALDVGLAMNIAWALLLALMISLAWEVSGYFIARKRWRLLLLTALMLGGDGLSPLMPWLIKHPAATEAATLANQAVERVWSSTRFAGLYDQQVNTTLGRFIAGNPQSAASQQALELPLETIAYYSVLGDYHPPLGGFVIALWSLALTAGLGIRKIASSADRVIFFALGLSPAVILALNPWVLPLQGILLLSWLLLRYWYADIHWPALLIGGVAGLGLIYPFLSYFAPNALQTPFKWVNTGEHSPWSFFLAMHWPLLLWLGTGLSLLKKQPWVGWLTLTMLILLLASEFIYVDDSLGGKYQRFNTTLKWWSWLWPTALVGLGSSILGQGGRFAKGIMSISFILLLTYALDLGRYWRDVTKPQLGQLAGDGWLKQDDSLREMLIFLKSAPSGLVMESVPQGAYAPNSALATFANKPLVLGWPDHESQWRNFPAYIANRAQQIRSFYQGTLLEPLNFLNQFPVRYIVWTAADEQRFPGGQQKLHTQISHEYHWRAFSHIVNSIGIWERRQG